MATEQTLEDVLRDIGKLREDLSAVKIIGTKKVGSHLENVTYREEWRGGPGDEGRNVDYIYRTEQVEVDDYEDVFESDIQKQKSARRQLQQIYDSSEWYSARYKAGRSLKVDESKISQQTKDWLDELAKKTSVKGTYGLIWERRGGYAEGIEVCLGYGFEENANGADIMFRLDKIKGASEDVRTLYKLSETRDIREICGKLMNFSEVQILGDEFNRSSYGLTISELGIIYKNSQDKKLKKKAKEKLQERFHQAITTFKPDEKEIQSIGKELNYSQLRIWANKKDLYGDNFIAVMLCVALGVTGVASLIHYYLTR